MASIIQKKRLTNEVKIIEKQPLHYCTAYPDESNPLIWYFLIKGQRGTDYHTGTKNSEGKYIGGEGGEYIGKIVHSPKYPAEPPDYYMLTPSGRYKVGSKICLTNSSYHKGDWSSTWNILSILIAFYSIWLDDKEHGISHITDTPANRRKMAAESIAYNLKNNKEIYDKFNRTHLRDDAPVILKEKVVKDDAKEEAKEANQEGKQETNQEGKQETNQEGKQEAKQEGIQLQLTQTEMTEMTEMKEVKVMKNSIVIDDLKNEEIGGANKIEVVKDKKIKKTSKKVA